MRKIPITVDPALLIAAPVLLITIPLRWCAAFVLAALLHEGAHVFSVLLLGGRIHYVRIGLSNAEIHVSLLSPFFEFLSILSGPAVSLLLYNYRVSFPELAFFGFFQGVVNLLPVLPLDGGRLTHLILSFFVSGYVSSVMNCIRICILSIIFFIGLLSAAKQIPLISWFAALILFSLIRKSPCKPDGIKVQ